MMSGVKDFFLTFLCVGVYNCVYIMSTENDNNTLIVKTHIANINAVNWLDGVQVEAMSTEFASPIHKQTITAVTIGTLLYDLVQGTVEGSTETVTQLNSTMQMATRVFQDLVKGADPDDYM